MAFKRRIFNFLFKGSSTFVDGLFNFLVKDFTPCGCFMRLYLNKNHVFVLKNAIWEELIPIQTTSIR